MTFKVIDTLTGKEPTDRVSYLSGYKTEIADGQVKKVLDEVLKGDKAE